MLKSLRIENFRCFKEYELRQLGRVNLLVGMNNNGKTAILEAIHLLYSQGHSTKLAEILINRNEFVWNFSENRNNNVWSQPDTKKRELEICHLFYNHTIYEDINFLISGTLTKNNSNKHDLKMEVKIISGSSLDSKLSSFERSIYSSESLKFQIKYEYLVSEAKEGIMQFNSFGLLSDFNLLSKDLEDYENSNINKIKFNSLFLTYSSIALVKMIELFENILLTPEEDLVIEALQIIEPTIKRIAVVDNRFFALLSDNNQRIPIGSMGDGIQRILGLALALVNAKDGILLVDEIDTGLHFTAMSKMWKLVWETAQKLNVQVFATTHNSDCWTSLTDLIDPDNQSEDGITLHRIEKDKPHSILFSERQIAIAAERGIEVR